MDLPKEPTWEELQTILNGVSEGVSWNVLVRDSLGDVIDYRLLFTNNAFLRTADFDGSLSPVGSLATDLYGMDKTFIQAFYQSHRTVRATVTTEYQSSRSGKWFRVSTSPFEKDKFVTSFLDITQAVEARLKREQDIQVEAVGALAGILAHDFNNLLGGLEAQIQMLRDETQTETTRPRMEKICSLLARARAMTRQVSTVSDAQTIRPRLVSVRDLLLDAVALVTEGRSIGVIDQVAKDLWPCRLDADQWSRAFDNLVRNAIEAMGGTGSLTLRAWNHRWNLGDPVLLTGTCYVRLEIQDTGPGIPAEVLSHLFDPHFTTKADGHGLGLASVFAIVRRHLGLVTASTEPGAGTTFSLWIPAEG